MITAILLARKQKQLTQKEAAKQIGITRNFYSMIERGERIPSVITLARIQNVLGIENVDLREYDKN